MAREVNRLSARAVTTLTKPGRHADGNGLYLVIDKSGARRWLFLFRWQGKLKEMGLGGLSVVGLADARAKASEARRSLDAGENPIEARRKAEAAREAVQTFGAFVDALLPTITKTFRNAKHRAQWKSTLDTHAAKLRPMRLDAIETTDVLATLKPIWQAKPETASRLRGRIEHVLAAATAEGLRTGDNPARWRNHLDKLLPKRGKLTRGHHAAMPYTAVPAFIADLREREAIAARALEFAILCASRSGEVLGARWSEVDLAEKVWTIPAERMKNGKPHRVPLTTRALAILADMKEGKRGEHVFPGAKAKRPLSSHALLMLMRRTTAKEFTPHGFRSSFRDWAGETTNFPRDVVEMALAHTVGDATERAYRRGDALEKRRKLLEAWARFVSTVKADAKVIKLRPAQAS
ncbi:MAG TPA: integrase arm-type DNA-binding domain-containing protein [Bosea sp. (in: a-proteobacteria)]|jgi:integrase|uniref:tyrosine-type recombinase/integrase n=1 Tax=Bosea sp. (in: a-proteobacteria) TaxID=1871050 RepID=UPI002DDCDAF8|nr:integrase arm-type DNA-binding domain-containing protein [Bosea sp. (in: a-proteobacteria)]HEV2555261.1 integrase arm-type DNA-binding domain-containing protein [Bosea sp. (in: a-proteobacteria)]